MTLTKLAFIVATFGFIATSIILSISSYNSSNIANIVSTPTTINSTPVPTKIPNSKPTILTPTVNNRCLIVVDGQKYDVTTFRSQHSGGNIFNCGTDMSNIFHDKHNQRYLQMMQPYKI